MAAADTVLRLPLAERRTHAREITAPISRLPSLALRLPAASHPCDQERAVKDRGTPIAQRHSPASS
jgi:hypothetical protein